MIGEAPPPEDRRLRLWLEPGAFAICRLPPDRAIPPAVLTARLWSVTRTHDELSVVCPAELAPEPDEAVDVDAPWRLLAVSGPLDFGLVGILRDLSATLADADVPLFAVSTYDTDLLLVAAGRLDDALAALAGAGHEVRSSRRSATAAADGTDAGLRAIEPVGVDGGFRALPDRRGGP